MLTVNIPSLIVPHQIQEQKSNPFNAAVWKAKKKSSSYITWNALKSWKWVLFWSPDLLLVSKHIDDESSTEHLLLVIRVIQTA